MANTYTLHVPASAEPGDAEALDKAELVRDGFAWGAFLFTFLWFFGHRLWLTGPVVESLTAILAEGSIRRIASAAIRNRATS